MTRAQRRPNVIVIMADDMGYGDIAAVGGGRNRTPTLDRMLDESLCLDFAYSASPVCAPARAALLTGRYPHRTGCTDLGPVAGLDRLAPGERTVAEVFRDAGYETALVGKWHCGTTPDSRPEHRGFGHVDAFHPRGLDHWNWRLEGEGTRVDAEDGVYLADALTERALAFVTAHRDRPFFLHLAHYAPHRPLQAPAEIVARYAADPRLTPGQAVVYAMIEAMDAGIGRLLDRLSDLSLADDTIVVFTSDNGPDVVSDGELSPVRENCDLRGHKYDVHEGGIRVPFLVRWPAAVPARRSAVPFHFVDVLPTLAAACAIPTAASPPLDGESRLALWRGDDANTSDERYWQWNRYRPAAECNAAIRRGDWKLVVPAREGFRDMTAQHRRMLAGREPSGTLTTSAPVLGPAHAPQLFDLATDPGERVDLAAQHPALVRDLHERLAAWFDTVEADLDRVIAERTPTPRTP